MSNCLQVSGQIHFCTSDSSLTNYKRNYVQRNKWPNSKGIHGQSIGLLGSVDNDIMPQKSLWISVTVQFIEKSAVYNRQNYQWSEYRGIPYAEAERFEYSSQGFSDSPSRTAHSFKSE